MEASCKAYRAGLRRALAELTMLRGEAEARVGKGQSPRSRTTQSVRAQTYATACNELNKLLDDRCECGALHYQPRRRSLYCSPRPEPSRFPEPIELLALRVCGILEHGGGA